MPRVDDRPAVAGAPICAGVRGLDVIFAEVCDTGNRMNFSVDAVWRCGIWLSCIARFDRAVYWIM